MSKKNDKFDEEAHEYMESLRARLKQLVNLGVRHEPNIHLPNAMLALDPADVAVLRIASDVLLAKVLPQMLAHSDCGSDECGIYADDTFQQVIDILASLYYLSKGYDETVAGYLDATGLQTVSEVRRAVASHEHAGDWRWMAAVMRRLHEAGLSEGDPIPDDAEIEREHARRRVIKPIALHRHGGGFDA